MPVQPLYPQRLFEAARCACFFELVALLSQYLEAVFLRRSD